MNGSSHLDRGPLRGAWSQAALLVTTATLFALPSPGRAAESLVRLSAGVSTVDGAYVNNPGATAGVDLEVGVFAPMAIVLGFEFSRWQSDGSSPYVTGTRNYNDFSGGIRLRWPSGAFRPYADVMLVAANGDFDGSVGASGGAGISWGSAHGPRLIFEARAVATTDMDYSSNFVFGRAGVAFPLRER